MLSGTRGGEAEHDLAGSRGGMGRDGEGVFHRAAVCWCAASCRAAPLFAAPWLEGRESEIGPCSRSLWGDRCLSVIGAVLTLVWV